MTKRRKILVGVALAAAVVVGGGGIALATGLAGGDEELSGSDLDRASEAALAEVGDGRVTRAEVGDDGVAYELNHPRQRPARSTSTWTPRSRSSGSTRTTIATGTAPPRAAGRNRPAARPDAATTWSARPGRRPRPATARGGARHGDLNAEHADRGTGYEVTVITDAGAEFDIVLDEAFVVVSSTEDLDD